MNPIQRSFQTLQPSEDFEQRLLEKTEQAQSHRKAPLRLVLIAAVIVCLIVTVTAVGLSEHWLESWFKTDSEAEFFVEHTSPVSSSGSYNNLTVTYENIFNDGPFLVMEVSYSHTDGSALTAEEVESGFGQQTRMQMRLKTPQKIVYPVEGTGEALIREDMGFGGYSRRLDDGSDPTRCVYSYCFILSLSAEYSQLVGNSVFIDTMDAGEWAPDGSCIREPVCITSYELPLRKPDSEREETLTNGRTVKISSLGAQIQGLEFQGTPSFDANSTDDCPRGVILDDGSRVKFYFHIIGRSSVTKSEDIWETYIFGEKIDPSRVVAVYNEDGEFPIA